MSDVLIRDVPDEVLSALDERAKRLGLSRGEYLRRGLIRDARVADEPVTVDDLHTFAQRFGDLREPDVETAAWS